MRGYFITGTNTDIGKTVASAWLMLHLGADYYKPAQAGLEETDRQTVQDITDLPADRFHPCTYELTQPLSPHESAKRDGITIEMDKFSLPQTVHPLIVEGAGGLMVPLNDDNLVIDLIAQLKLPIILVCNSRLGTINHTLLSLEAIRARNLPIAGLIMSGHKSPHNREALEQYGGGVPIIAEIDHLDHLSAKNLLAIKPEVQL
jgi:dethiobiotin synthase